MALCLLSFYLWSSGPGVCGAEEGAKQELKKFQGVWNYDLGEIRHEGGRQTVAMPADTQKRIQVRKNKFRFRQDETKPWLWEATITLKPGANPKQLKLTRKVKEGGKVKTVVEHAIYQITGGGKYLHIHFGLPGKPAPKRFLELNKQVKGVDGRAWTLTRAAEGNK
jgi:uncharacterized protein (TIGR03067 family)